MTDDVLLDVRDLKTHFPIHSGVFSSVVGHVKAVDGVSFRVRRGKTLGLVGESGCGKTTVGRTVLRLIPATAGEVKIRLPVSAAIGSRPPAFPVSAKANEPMREVDVFRCSGRELRGLRRHMQIIFQDPVGSLNPRMTVGSIVGEGLSIHGMASGADRRDRVAALLERVGLAAVHMNRYPHEFSGGQRQRIGIARALALQPDFIVCDEPVSALDVSIQSQILNLLSDLQDEYGLSYLFIAHNLAVVEHFSDDVAVMYLGRIVEQAPGDRIYHDARHPYTKALLSAIPIPEPGAKSNRIVLAGEVPSPSKPPSGCRFHPRCSEFRAGICDRFDPALEALPGDDSHLSACWAVPTARRAAWEVPNKSGYAAIAV